MVNGPYFENDTSILLLAAKPGEVETSGTWGRLWNYTISGSLEEGFSCVGLDGFPTFRFKVYLKSSNALYTQGFLGLDRLQ